jgi:hypothetical protein
MEESMSQTQAIFTPRTSSPSSIQEIIGNAISQTVDWLGRTITYTRGLIVEYATKAWNFATRCFEKVMDFISPKHPLPRSFEVRVNL